jgi:hypothetical protein
MAGWIVRIALTTGMRAPQVLFSALVPIRSRLLNPRLQICLVRIELATVALRAVRTSPALLTQITTRRVA